MHSISRSINGLLVVLIGILEVDRSGLITESVNALKRLVL